MKTSAGILLYRTTQGHLQVMLVHPGGPFWAKKEEGAWTVPKGEVAEGEDVLATAKREFQEETGITIDGDFIALAPIKQAGGKVVHAFALEMDVDVSAIKSNTFPLEWPPKSGRILQVPEVDRAEWFDMPTARNKINKAQVELLDELIQLLPR
ncbi:NUDIX domain-containing protein [soil metagenome]